MASAPVAPEWPGLGTPAESGGAPQPALPGLQSDNQRTVTVGGTAYTVPPQASLQAALAKARTNSLWRLVAWQPDLQQWWVPSRTTPGMAYWLHVRKGTERGHPWWLRLQCNCDAEQSGRYLACWHKAAVATWHTARARMVPGTPVSSVALLGSR